MEAVRDQEGVHRTRHAWYGAQIAQRTIAVRMHSSLASDDAKDHRSGRKEGGQTESPKGTLSSKADAGETRERGPGLPLVA